MDFEDTIIYIISVTLVIGTIAMLVIVLIFGYQESLKQEICECLGYDQYDIFTSMCIKKAYHNNGYTYDILYSDPIDFDKAKVICENKKKNEVSRLR